MVNWPSFFCVLLKNSFKNIIIEGKAKIIENTIQVRAYKTFRKVRINE